MMTRLAESSGRPLERHGNVSPREMTVEGAKDPGTEPGVQADPFTSDDDGPGIREIQDAGAVACTR